jgi:hypothetical protein
LCYAACAQGALAAKEKLAGAQQQTIRQLERTIGEQRADIRAALELVSRRPAGAEAGTGLGGPGEEDEAEPAGSWQLGEGDAGSGYSVGCYDWEAAATAPAPENATFAGGWGPDCSSEFAAGASSTDGQLASLLDAATAAADAATAWAGGFGSSDAASAGDGNWLLDYGLHSSAAAPGTSDNSASWQIPAIGADYSGDSGFASPLRTSAPPSPANEAAAAAAAASPYRQRPQARKGPKGPAQSLQGSPSPLAAAPALASVQADIAGLEDALRSALFDLQI